MSNQGWISIHRKIKDHWLWGKSKKKTKFEAWIDLLLMANHKDKKINFGNNVITVKRGQKITSILDLSKRWKWSRDKVKNFLILLQNDSIIEFKSDNKKTTITIINYDTYQNDNIQKRHQSDINPTSIRHQSDTNNNVNNENNENNKEKNIKKKSIKRQIEIPENFNLSEKMKSYCMDKSFTKKPNLMFEDFKNHHTAKGTKFKDWESAWQTWCRNDYKYNNPKQEETKIPKMLIIPEAIEKVQKELKEYDERQNSQFQEQTI